MFCTQSCLIWKWWGLRTLHWKPIYLHTLAYYERSDIIVKVIIHHRYHSMLYVLYYVNISIIVRTVPATSNCNIKRLWSSQKRLSPDVQQMWLNQGTVGTPGYWETGPLLVSGGMFGVPSPKPLGIAHLDTPVNVYSFTPIQDIQFWEDTWSVLGYCIRICNALTRLLYPEQVWFRHAW